ncbi:cytochrome b561 domain-containing protein At2g30890-like [Carex rostrata]
MLALKREKTVVIFVWFVLLTIIVPSVESARNITDQSHNDSQSRPLKLNPKLSLQIKIHALLLWGSVGFLMPIGILVIRFASSCTCGKYSRVLFYLHVVLQTAAVALATAGAVLSLKNFQNSFNNTHQRIGLALYGFIWFQPLLGFLRPNRGVKARSVWYLIHWLIGIIICMVGIANIYIGLHTYHEKTSKSVRLWVVLFTIEISLIGFAYLLQDRWQYILEQGARHCDEQIRPTDNMNSPSTSVNKEHVAIPRIRDFLD